VICKLTKEKNVNELSKTLLDAEHSMNNGGEHWIQGAMCRVLDQDTRAKVEDYLGYRAYGDEDNYLVKKVLERDPRACGFCAVGAIRWAIYEDYDPSYPEKYTLADLNRYQAALGALQATETVTSYWAKRSGNYTPDLCTDNVDEMEGNIIDWNDNVKETSWADVNRAFREAAIAAESNWFKRQALRLRLALR
jgi:hypothetical protein